MLSAETQSAIQILGQSVSAMSIIVFSSFSPYILRLKESLVLYVFEKLSQDDLLEKFFRAFHLQTQLWNNINKKIRRVQQNLSPHTKLFECAVCRWTPNNSSYRHMLMCNDIYPFVD